MAEFRLSNFTSGNALTAAELNTGLTFTDYTPDWTQSATITKTVNWARYTKFGKLVVASIKMTASSSGTGNNKMLVSLPVNASSNNYIMGSFTYLDTSDVADQLITAQVIYESASTVAFFPSNYRSDIGSARTATTGTADANINIRWGQDWTSSGGAANTGPVVASGDVIFIQLMYEAA